MLGLVDRMQGLGFATAFAFFANTTVTVAMTKNNSVSSRSSKVNNNDDNNNSNSSNNHNNNNSKAVLRAYMLGLFGVDLGMNAAHT